MKVPSLLFTQAYNLYFSVKDKDPHIQKAITLSGKQLREFCELYFKHRVENCALKHFPTTSDRNHYIGFGFALGLILALIIHLIIFYYGK